MSGEIENASPIPASFQHTRRRTREYQNERLFIIRNNRRPPWKWRNKRQVLENSIHVSLLRNRCVESLRTHADARTASGEVQNQIGATLHRVLEIRVFSGVQVEHDLHIVLLFARKFANLQLAGVR